MSTFAQLIAAHIYTDALTEAITYSQQGTVSYSPTGAATETSATVESIDAVVVDLEFDQQSKTQGRYCKVQIPAGSFTAITAPLLGDIITIPSQSRKVRVDGIRYHRAQDELISWGLMCRDL